MNIQDAIDVIESVAGFTDESTPVGEAWLEVLSFIHRPTALAQPEPEGVTDEEWCVLKMRLWEQYETVGYQGERFMYDLDFYTALDVARQEITRYASPTIEPVPGAEVG